MIGSSTPEEEIFSGATQLLIMAVTSFEVPLKFVAAALGMCEELTDGRTPEFRAVCHPVEADLLPDQGVALKWLVGQRL